MEGALPPGGEFNTDGIINEELWTQVRMKQRDEPGLPRHRYAFPRPRLSPRSACRRLPGSLVECRAPDDIWREYPKGVRELADGGTRNTIAGRPTDDSEMAMSLAHVLADQGRSDPEEARKAYIFWLGRDRFYLHP